MTVQSFETKVMKNLLIAITFFSMLLSGCKVSYSFRGGEIPGKTFSVGTLTNSASLVNPNLAIVMQDKLQEKFTNESNLKYTDGNGDANFSGRITSYKVSPVQGTGATTVALNRLTIAVEFLYTNPDDKTVPEEGKVIKVSSYDDFESTEDFSSIEDELMESISEKLVALVYNQVLVDW